MANPAVTQRTFPSGVRLDNGYQSLVVFSLAPALDIFEKSVQPPADDGGDPILTDTMLNQERVTKAPQCLISADDAVIVAAYDPGQYSDILAMLNVPQTISYLYPDGSAQAHYGFIRRIERSPLVKGEQPEVTITIVQSDWDPVNCVEEGPVFTDGTGSCTPCVTHFD